MGSGVYRVVLERLDELAARCGEYPVDFYRILRAHGVEVGETLYVPGASRIRAMLVTERGVSEMEAHYGIPPRTTPITRPHGPKSRKVKPLRPVPPPVNAWVPKVVPPPPATKTRIAADDPRAPTLSKGWKQRLTGSAPRTCVEGACPYEGGLAHVIDRLPPRTIRLCDEHFALRRQRLRNDGADLVRSPLRSVG